MDNDEALHTMSPIWAQLNLPCTDQGAHTNLQCVVVVLPLFIVLFFDVLNEVFEGVLIKQSWHLQTAQTTGAASSYDLIIY